jgi:hypothetical protein
MNSEAAWKQTELDSDEVSAWGAVGAQDAVRTMELIEAGWSPDMAGLAVSYRGEWVSIARAVSLGMTLDEAERELWASRRA